MRIRDEKLLKEFRQPGRCESCTKWCERREPAHIYTRGMGGATRLDIRENLVSLGSSVPYPICLCHTMHHKGREPTKKTLLKIVAARERKSVADIERIIREVLRADKHALPRSARQGKARSRRRSARSDDQQQAVQSGDGGQGIPAGEGQWREF